MNPARIVFAAFIPLVLPLPAPLAWAQTETTPAPPAANPVDAQAPTLPTLTLAEALDRARRLNRDLEAARARVEQAGTQINQAWTALLPQINAQGKYTRTKGDIQYMAFYIQRRDQLDGVISGTIPVLVPYGWAGLSAAKKSTQAAEASFAVNEISVLFATAQAFYTAAGTDELGRARKSAVDVAHVTLKDARSRFDAGTATRVDVSRAELASVRAEQAERDVVVLHDQAYRALATLIQRKPPFVVVPPAEVPAASSSASDKDALALRPEFQSLEATLAVQDEQRLTAKLRWLPTVSLFGQFKESNAAGFTGNPFWALGAQLDWALFDGGARDVTRRLAWAQRRETEAQVAKFQDTLNDELADARAQQQNKRKASEVAVQAAALARETLDLVRIQYEAGTVIQTDLLTAQDNLTTAEADLVQARFDAAIADLTLQKAAGTFAAR